MQQSGQIESPSWRSGCAASVAWDTVCSLVQGSLLLTCAQFCKPVQTCSGAQNTHLLQWVPHRALKAVCPSSKPTESSQKEGHIFFPQELLHKLHVQGFHLPRGAAFS